MRMRVLLATILVCVTGLIASQAHANTSQSWRFTVFLDDKAVGQHTFQVINEDNSRYVTVHAKFNVSILFFNAYSYQHSNHEVWHGECLSSIRSQTNDNGETQFVQGELQGKVFHLRTSQGENEIPGCVRTFAYWDPSFLNSRYLLNAQTGELMPVSINDLGRESITVKDKTVVSQHYRISTDQFSIDLWYSPQREWLALQSTTRDGAVLRYQRQ